jgi:ankyrin repeat protein
MKKTLTLLLFGLPFSLLLAQTDPIPENKEAGVPEQIKTRIQEGLFAEEVDQNLDKAAEAYTEVLRLFQESRETAATAAFRLGEVHRKLAGSNPESEHWEKAALHYERVIREFSDNRTLVKLGEQNLVAMGRPIPGGKETVVDDAELRRIRELEEWVKTSPDKLTETPTPLYQAAKENHLRVAGFLIKSGVDLESGGPEGTPMTVASAAGHLAMVEKLVEAGADPRSNDFSGLPPIHVALSNDRMAVVKKLIEVGAHLEVRTRKGETPLMVLVRDPRTELVVRIEKALEYATLLTKAGVDLNETNDEGENALMVAMPNGVPRMVDWLLTNGAKANAVRKSDGVTALHLAAKERNDLLATRLIEAGAEVNLADNNGISPLHQALASAANLKLVELLLQAGADVNQRIGPEGWTPMHVWAALSNNDEVGRLLHRAGGNPIAVSSKVPKILNPTNLPSDPTFTPLSLLERRRGKHLPVVREMYEGAVKTLAAGDFGRSVWFLMPPQLNQKDHPRSQEAPTKHLPNLFPVFDRGEPDSSPPNLASLIVAVFDGGNTNRNPYQVKPRLDAIRILRSAPAANGGKSGWTTLLIPYKELIGKSDASGDPRLQWGDVVLFDQEQGRENGAWNRHEEETVTHLYRAASVTFQLTLGNVTEEVRVVPELEYKQVSVLGDYLTTISDRIAEDLQNVGSIIRFREDLDLSAIRVRRKTQGTDTEFRLVLDPSGKEMFFLQDGDEVIIPHREGIQGMLPKDRSKHIWISCPGTHFLNKAESRENFAGRELDGLPLARVLASYFTGEHSQFSRELPFPDLASIRIDSTDPSSKKETMVSLSENATEHIPWGAILQIPMKQGSHPASWTGLSVDEKAQIRKLSGFTFTLVPEGMEKRQVKFEFFFPDFERGTNGELLLSSTASLPRPEVHRLFSDEFTGNEAKWDSQRVIFETGGEARELPAFSVPALLEGDVVKLLRKL